MHPGNARRFDPAAEAALEALLTAGDPPVSGSAATGWTVPLLRSELAKRGWEAAQRTLHQLGWRWKRPKLEAAHIRVRPSRPGLCREKSQH